MAHAEGWTEAYDALDEGRSLSADLLSTVLKNRNGLGESMLHRYAIEGEPAVIEKIIGIGFDVNATNKFGRTPLFECVMIERWEVAELLLNHGARTDIRDQNDEDVFAYFDEGGEHEKAQQLKELTSRLIHGGGQMPRATVARAFCPEPCASLWYHAPNTEHCGAPPLQNP
jgi:ankyrin repeat protein